MKRKRFIVYFDPLEAEENEEALKKIFKEIKKCLAGGGVLTLEQRRIIMLRYFNRKRRIMSFRAIAKKMGLSHEWVRKLHKKAIASLRKFLPSFGSETLRSLLFFNGRFYKFSE